jgi:hypothetical protein
MQSNSAANTTGRIQFCRVTTDIEINNVWRQNAACRRSHCCNRKTTMPFLCIVELYVTVNIVKILGVAQQCRYGEIMLPATMKRIYVFT